MNQEFIQNLFDITLNTKLHIIHVKIYSYLVASGPVRVNVKIISKKHKNVKTYVWNIKEENPLPDKFKELVDGYIVMYALNKSNLE